MLKTYSTYYDIKQASNLYCKALLQYNHVTFGGLGSIAHVASLHSTNNTNVYFIFGTSYYESRCVVSQP